ncbi:MAG TPA: GNAT family N-acetyltransferase [Burkholderiaceae bacterium]|jgi:ribosomal protein S18 acetylase RimI-like enzyme|nr:GNAT family N-acetyltransferase [Burkholderiaceae bacterium]
MTAPIVPVEMRHIESLNDCVAEVARERRFLSIVEGFTLDQTAAWVAADRLRGNPFLVILDQDQVVGWCEVRRDLLPGRAHTGLLGMGLRAPYRGRGLGRQLIEHALRQARERGFERIELLVRSPNARAMRLYSQVGFQEEGRKRDAVRLDVGSEDEVLMALHLRENS